MAISKRSSHGGKSPRGVGVGSKLPRKGKVAVDKVAVGKVALAISPKVALRGGNLVARFLDSRGIVMVDRVVKGFGMSKQQLAETMGVKPETVYRSSRVSAPKTQTRATEMLEIVGRIADWAGGEKQAMAWYRAEPIAAFGGRTAESLVKEGKAAAVRDYLDHVATGGFA
jgi:uncharacterized protein (DUF2384 family)